MISEPYEMLQVLRQTAGLTQEEVAERIGIERATYARYESGARKISAQALLRLAHFYEVTPEYIMLMDEADERRDDWEKQIIFDTKRLNAAGRVQLQEYLRFLLTNASYTKDTSRKAM